MQSLNPNLGAVIVAILSQDVVSTDAFQHGGLAAKCGNFKNEVEKEAFTSGNDIILTLNSELQRTAYESMAGKKGSVVALDPRNGEILTMISMPSCRGMPGPVNIGKGKIRALRSIKKNLSP